MVIDKVRADVKQYFVVQHFRVSCAITIRCVIRID